MNINWKGCGRKRQLSNLRHYPGMSLKGLSKTTKNSSQDSPFQDRELEVDTKFSPVSLGLIEITRPFFETVEARFVQECVP
jgi:hypothetical protein